MIAEPQVESWKNQPYVWMLILIPFSAVIMGVIMVTLAIESETGLVVDDYYKKGKQINQVLARDQAAATLDLTADISFDIDSAEVHVNLAANKELNDGEIITLGFYHATRPGMDQSHRLQQISANHYAGQFDSLAKGRWHVQLATDSWRLTGSLHRPGGDKLELSAIPVK